MVGLNVSRGITRQVAQEGFSSLSETQREELDGGSCNVTREYRDFIRSAFGAHGHGSMDFIRFCEAQLVWDTAMAINAVNHLEQHPDRMMVLLARSGHARKLGIPYQVKSRSPILTSPYGCPVHTGHLRTRTASPTQKLGLKTFLKRRLH
jgi:uncharacterized iron-regulated protein